jgi:hypothetical protein
MQLLQRFLPPEHEKENRGGVSKDCPGACARRKWAVRGVGEQRANAICEGNGVRAGE